MILYICLETKKMWATSRKCVFYSIFKNTTKYLKIFFKAFFLNATKHLKIFFGNFLFQKIFSPENISHLENVLHRAKRNLSYIVLPTYFHTHIVTTILCGRIWLTICHYHINSLIFFSTTYSLPCKKIVTKRMAPSIIKRCTESTFNKLLVQF